MATESQANAAKSKHSAHLRTLPGVCGVGTEKDASGEYDVAVHLDAGVPEAGNAVPSMLDGVEVRRYRGEAFKKF